MAKARPAIKEPVLITFPDETRLTTTTDPQSRKHKTECDICGIAITLTVTAHPRAIFDHRGSSGCRQMADKQDGDNAGSSKSRRHKSFKSISSIVSSFSNLHTASPTRQPAASPAVSPSVSHPIPVKKVSYPGVRVQWEPGSIWATYPYHQHEIKTKLGWKPIAFGKDNNLVLRDANFHEFAKCAAALDSKPHSPWGYRERSQTVTSADGKKKKPKRRRKNTKTTS